MLRLFSCDWKYHCCSTALELEVGGGRKISEFSTIRMLYSVGVQVLAAYIDQKQIWLCLGVIYAVAQMYYGTKVLVVIKPIGNIFSCFPEFLSMSLLQDRLVFHQTHYLPCVLFLICARIWNKRPGGKRVHNMCILKHHNSTWIYQGCLFYFNVFVTLPFQGNWF